MRTVSSKSKKIIAYMQAHPSMKAGETAKLFKVSVASVYALRSKMKSAAPKTVKRKGSWELASVSTSKKSARQKPSTLAPNAVASMHLYADDKVNSPSHYKVGGIETIDFIEAKQLDYHLGNVVKYISRADHKDDKLENLKKAQWYLNRAVANLSKT
jgi:hypothetical protein